MWIWSIQFVRFGDSSGYSHLANISFPQKIWKGTATETTVLCLLPVGPGIPAAPVIDGKWMEDVGGVWGRIRSRAVSILATHLWELGIKWKSGSSELFLIVLQSEPTFLLPLPPLQNSSFPSNSLGIREDIRPLSSFLKKSFQLSNVVIIKIFKIPEAKEPCPQNNKSL